MQNALLIGHMNLNTSTDHADKTMQLKFRALLVETQLHKHTVHSVQWSWYFKTFQKNTVLS